MPSRPTRMLLPLGAALALGATAILPAAGTVPSAAPDDVLTGTRSVVEVQPGATFPSAPNLEPLPVEPTVEDVRRHMAAGDTVSYTHLTLPTICSV